MDQVKEGMMITIEYRLQTTTRYGDSQAMEPISTNFVLGVDAQYPSVEAALMNKRVGDHFRVRVGPEELYGTYEEDLVRELPRADYREDRLQVGRMYRQIRKMSLVQFLVRELRDDVIVADFNDPRAGSWADFDITVKAVREATPSELKPSCLPRREGCM
jgi:FKBP-type peptidyl-prolyl cis-trans isomerase SlyD